MDWEWLSEEQVAILVASILGDGEITKCYAYDRRINNSYREHFSLGQLSYREWKQRKLPDLLYLRGNNLVSRSLPLMTRLFPFFYPNNKKHIPFELLKDIYHTACILTLYLDDGSLLLSKRFNHKKKEIQFTPHIAFYLQAFSKEQLEQLAEWMRDHYNINVRMSGTPSGTGYYLKTTKVTDTFDILNLLQPYQAELPDFMYKLSWENRLDAEVNHYKQTHPDYTIRVSIPARPYSHDEVTSLIEWKQQGVTDKEIAQRLNRTYWSVVYKWHDVKNREA
ncbi:LAGLIDADG DNA endonuclease [Exiguobacterium sp. JLM-2]|uniref:LAGLIDADG DNA endonuclease n=1 Tax=Exiguobacterium sp. JLM-2 TaxID=1647415 RepID=UPI00064A4D95|nr:LAGLIDADG DNA endonuclease [Exiguobacterium sp. JLM-2]